jgi:hypothetical protein
MGNVIDVGTYKNLLLGLTRGPGGTDIIPGWGPSPTPTATPTTAVTWSPSATQTATVPSATPSPEVPTATCTATPTASPSATVTTPPTWVQTATLTCTATPTLTPVPSTVATATSTPTSTVPPVATAVPPADCKPAVERVQVVPCPVLDAKGGRIKVRLGACVPGTLKVTVYTTAGAAVATLDIDVAGLGAGWNDIAIPPHSYTPGLYYFKVTASANGSSSESTGSCMVLR